METKAVEFKFTTTEAGAVAGYASLFGRPADAVGDVVAEGAFDRTLASATELPILVEHKGERVGAWAELEADEMGLRAKGKLDLGSEAGRAAYDALQRGDLDGLSIGYIATKADRDSDGSRVLQDVDLREISLVKRPASSRARVLSVKSDGTAATGAASTMEANMADTTEAPADAAGSGETEVKALGDRLASIETKVSDITNVRSKVDNLAERVEAVETKANRPGAPAQPKNDDDGKVEVKAFESFLRAGDHRIDANEAKNLRVSDDTAGGYLAPEQFSDELIRNLVEVSPVRQAARVSNTSAGSVKFPKRTATSSAKWVGETATRSESQPSYGQVEVVAQELATFTDVSNTLLEDSGIDLAAELRRDFAEDFGRSEGVAMLTGDGVGKPEGILTNGDVQEVKNGSTSDLKVDGIIDFFHGLPMFYRNRGAWMANGATIGALRKLKDSNGDYLWREALSEGNPATLLGRPVVEAPDMPDVANGNTPLVFGDFAQAYRVLDRLGISVLRDPYSVQTEGMVRFHARRRVGGRVVKAEAIRKLVMQS